ncbi:hypothetical protein BW716_29335 [[Flexibacter] sp. ATCC 35208]|nr:hypothetical protein BW716_29335 [[Flexibacter] sp. ATCC 35208]
MNFQVNVVEIGILGNNYKGTFRKGSNSFLDAPVVNGMVLESRNGLYKFTYTVGNPRTGLIYYQAESAKPQPCNRQITMQSFRQQWYIIFGSNDT